MGNRFGRNQRRRAREQIAALEQRVHDQAGAMALDRALLRRQSQDLGACRERMKDWDERMRCILGRYTSAAINDVTFRVSWPEEIIQLPVFPQFDPGRMLDPLSEDTALYVEDIFHLLGELSEVDRLNLSRFMSFAILVYGRHPDGEARYGMSRTFLEELRRDGERGVSILAKKLAPEIARLLLVAQNAARKRA